MRKFLGSLCYLIGGVGIIWALQLVISCEIISAISREENLRFDFWDFILIANGHHNAYSSGYIVHVMRDLFILGSSIIVIGLGREQFVFKKSLHKETLHLVICPHCRKKTFSDAYCRFCGFNLITLEPSAEVKPMLPVWQMALFAYSGVSLLLVIINLLMIKLK